MEQGTERFGAALRHRRIRAGISQRELALRAGVSERSVRNIESGRVARPRVESARRLAEVVGLELEPLPGGADVRIGVLGPLSVWCGDSPAHVGPQKQRSLLALLAVQPGVVVGTEEIVDALWGERPPASCVGLVHTYGSRLRRALASLQAGEPAVSVSSMRGGYRLTAEMDGLDVQRFDELVAEARKAEGLEAVELFEPALGCWRGPVLADQPTGIRQHPAAVAAADRQIAAVLAYGDVALEIGIYSPVVDRMRALAHQQPLHEGLHARLMVALAGSGQQAAALRVFDDIRHRLADELGVEVGAELRDAHVRVLRNDLPTSGIVEVATQKPAELPADVTGFVGRCDDLERLDGVLSAAVANGGAALRIASIDGMPGVGKTALAVHWAHRVSDRFADGQLYVNLRGYDRSAPVRPQQAIARFLRALGVPADRVPADEDEAASRYRTLLAGRRVLVVLDNASSFEQVRPLLPGTSSCFVVVTSRDRLTDLAAAHGTHRISLDALEPVDAHALVAELIGAERAGAEREAVDELAWICGYLPLVLRVAAANLSVQTHTSVAEYATQVSDRGQLTDGDAVRAAFDLSYERLKPASRAIFPLLGLAPGDFTPDALACCAVPEATDVLRQLCVASLLQEPAAGRFRLHDLLRGYAAARAGELPDDVRTAAVTGLMDFYLRSADAAVRLLYPNVLRMPLPDATEASRAVSFASEDTALAWLDIERANLLEAVARAAELGVPAYAWRLVDSLRGYLLTRGYNAEGLAACPAALDAARTESDLRAEASILDVLGLLYYNLSEYERAKQAHTAALERSREVGDRATEAHSLHNLGGVLAA